MYRALKVLAFVVAVSGALGFAVPFENWMGLLTLPVTFGFGGLIFASACCFEQLHRDMKGDALENERQAQQ